MSNLLNRARRRALSIAAGMVVASGAVLGAEAAQAQAVTIADVSQIEGNAGTSIMTFTLTLDTNVAGPFTVSYQTVDGTALNGSDYNGSFGNLTFAGTAGETQTFGIVINGDTTFEPNESFTVRMPTATNLSVNITDTATGTITNDDAAPPIPTLTEWAMILMGLMLAGFAALTLQRQRVI